MLYNRLLIIPDYSIKNRLSLVAQTCNLSALVGRGRRVAGGQDFKASVNYMIMPLHSILGDSETLPQTNKQKPNISMSTSIYVWFSYFSFYSVLAVICLVLSMEEECKFRYPNSFNCTLTNQYYSLHPVG